MAESFKTALVTGATGDIGQAIVKLFIRDGFKKIAISGIEYDILEKMISELSSSECELVPLQVNLMNTYESEQLFSMAEKEIGGVEVLVNNAGIAKDNLIMKMSDSDWETVLKINLEACFRICRAAFRPMISRREGRIINMASVVGFSGNAGQVNYCATKAGLVGMSKALAQEIASRGITVNCIAPGFIDSAMTKNLPEKVKEKLLTATPMGRMGTPDEVAEVVSFLASKAASYITGTTIHVNGGLYSA
ncbi:MAG: 3-oxoacyl-[acyl-carrier-protein] reductase [Holosporales bacterium]|jgi:3-oxoacyl-[acyl-carrier protein] reductase|nr:3-oxoacyl-[acyl-carrier-protein] reductase [Holosporales bacterium]